MNFNGQVDRPLNDHCSYVCMYITDNERKILFDFSPWKQHWIR